MSRIDSYTYQLLELVPVDITKDTVTEIEACLSGSARPGGADSVRLKHWILRFVEASKDFRLMVADFVEWLVNRRPPWSAYQSLNSGRLVVLDKLTGVRPVGMGEIWR